MHRLVLLLLPVLLGLLVSASTASAASTATVDEVVAALREDPLHVSQQSSVTPDQAVVREALRDTRVPVYVAIVPQEDADAEELGIDGLMLRILEGLQDPEAVVVVVTDDQQLQAGDGGRAGVSAGAVLDEVLAARLDEPFSPATLTGALVDFARLVDEGGTSTPAPSVERPGSTRRTVGLVGLVAVAALGGGGWLYVRAQRRVLAAAPLTREDLVAQEPGWQGVADREAGTPQP